MNKTLGQTTSEIFTLLENYSPEESVKVLESVKTLLGITIYQGSSSATGGVSNQNNAMSQTANVSSKSGNAKMFFEEKKPSNKGEEFAVAAMYRIQNGLGEVHTKEDFKTVLKTDARRVFDDRNFARDIENARRQAGFFMTGDAKGEYILSVAGEKYVEALPDRVAAAEAKKTINNKKPKKVSKPKVKKPASK